MNIAKLHSIRKTSNPSGDRGFNFGRSCDCDKHLDAHQWAESVGRQSQDSILEIKEVSIFFFVCAALEWAALGPALVSRGPHLMRVDALTSPGNSSEQHRSSALC